MLWTCIGVGGVAGAWAGTLVNRFGLESIHRTFLGLMSATILATGAGIGAIPALLGGVLFGAAYVMLTGVHLIWGTNALPDRPATGLMIGFLTIAIGQTAGAPLFGFLLEWNGPETAVICFALVTALAGLLKARTTHVRVPAQNGVIVQHRHERSHPLIGQAKDRSAQPRPASASSKLYVVISLEPVCWVVFS